MRLRPELNQHRLDMMRAERERRREKALLHDATLRELRETGQEILIEMLTDGLRLHRAVLILDRKIEVLERGLKEGWHGVRGASEPLCGSDSEDARETR